MHKSLCPHLTTTTNFPFQHSSFELAHLSINLCQHCLQLVCLYHLPLTGRINLLMHSFFNSSLTRLNTATLQSSLLIVGNFNILVDVPLTICLSALLDDQGLHQSVTFPIHLKDHSFDLALTKHDDAVLQSTEPDFSLNVSNHYCVMWQLHLSCLSCPPVYVEEHGAVDIDTFRHDFRVRLLNSPQLSANQLHNLLLHLLDQHAPATQPRVPTRPPSPSHPLEASENGREQKASGSGQDCRFINRFSMLLTNSLIVSYSRLNFIL